MSTQKHFDHALYHNLFNNSWKSCHQLLKKVLVYLASLNMIIPIPFLFTTENLFQHALFNQSIVVHLVLSMKTSSKYSSNKLDNPNPGCREFLWWRATFAQVFLGKWWTTLKTGKIVNSIILNSVITIFQKMIRHKYFLHGVWLSTKLILKWIVEKESVSSPGENVYWLFLIDITQQNLLHS